MEEAARAASERKRQVGLRIAACRHIKRWKQKQLAAAVNVEALTVSRWERGQHMPDLDMLDLIAASLDTTAGFLLDGPTLPGEGAEDGIALEVADRLSTLEASDRRQEELLHELVRLVRGDPAEREEPDSRLPRAR